MALLNPGSITNLIQINYKVAEKAVTTVANALNYFEDSESLAVKLEGNRGLLEIWGRNSGVDEGKLDPFVARHHDLVQRQLAVISRTFENAYKIMKRYEIPSLEPGTAVEASQDRLQRSLGLMRRSLRMIGIKGDSTVDTSTASSAATATGQVGPGLLKRTKWGFHDKEKLGEIITSLSAHVSLLNELLSQSQRINASNDAERVKIILVGTVQDNETLATLRDTLRDVPGASETVARLERKAIADDQPWSNRQGVRALKPLPLDDLCRPTNYASYNRFLGGLKSDESVVLLFEKKEYERSLRTDQLNALTGRIQRLVQLLSTRTTTGGGFQVPTAVGYIQDTTNYCWWLVFHFPLRLRVDDVGLFPVPQPLTLQSLLDRASKIRPPLEIRYKLAASICTTFSELYSSSWLHKGISSKNILLRGQAPYAAAAPRTNHEQQAYSEVVLSLLSEPLVCGFDYSRQETEQETIDRAGASSDISTALYRHPNYQGDAAEGYKLAYDLYSLGMVLLEIALWVPIKSFLDAKKPHRSSSEVAGSSLSSAVKSFRKEEAQSFRKLALDRVNKEAAFRVGSAYRDAMSWCLTYADQPASTGSFSSQDQPPALEFHDHVLVPLRRLSSDRDNA